MISFFVPGKPIPQGSAKAFNIGGVARVVTGARSEATPLGGWRARIAHFAAQEMVGPPEIGPIRLWLGFLMQRPKSLAKKLDAPAISRRCGDLDKLQRAVLDGLTGIIFEDDCQVTEIEAAKAYAGDPEWDYKEPGVVVNIWFEGEDKE